MKQKFYLTTAIPYVNAEPHIGHALEFIYADVLARHWRIRGEETFFLTGSDEHGVNIAQKAKEQGVDPLIFCNKKVSRLQELKVALNLSYDDFARTSSEKHRKGVEKFWKLCMDHEDVYKKEYTGLYCSGCEAFKTPKDLVNDFCPDHKRKPEEIKEENYFFKLSRYRDILLKIFQNDPGFVYPKEKYNEVYQLLKSEGLEDISISRSREKLQWGIPVPNDDSQVIYVWFEALMIYATGVGYGSDDERFKKWWPADIHIIGKEINRFHSLIWPAMLLSAGLSLPKRIAVHGWMTSGGQKMSKTLGNVINPFELIQDYGTDPVRFFLLSEIPFDRDGDYSPERFKEKYNADLANELGNLLTRVSNMVERFFDANLPEGEVENSYDLSSIGRLIEDLKFDLALQEIWKIIKKGNQYIDQEKPWELFETRNIDKLANILRKLVVLIQDVSLALEPFMPESAEKIRKHFSKKELRKMPPLFPRILV